MTDAKPELKPCEWIRAAAEDNWDSYGGKATTQAAIRTAGYLCSVPTSQGGLQIELHAGGADIEIEIAADGKVIGAAWNRRAESA